MNTICIAENGKGDYPVYRIPGLVCTQKGTLLLYCEARMQRGDWGEIDILVYRSEDGEHFAPPYAAVRRTADSPLCGNPTMICDGDRIHLLYQKNYRRLFIRTSIDDGKTFGEERELTYAADEKRAVYDYTVLAPGPCHGIRHSGGRLLQPIWLACNHRDPYAHHPSCVGVLYSDDRGETFRMSDLILCDEKLCDPNETCITELADGTVLINMRNESSVGRRCIAKSTNCGESFLPYRFDERLVEPICCAGMTGCGDEIYFSHCTERGFPDSRRNLMLRYSPDGGKTWAKNKLIDEFAGYSDLCLDKNGDVLCFYEGGRMENGMHAALKLCHIAKTEW